MSVILEMLSFNVSLSQWKTYQPRYAGAGFFNSKNADKVAQSIFSQLSHPDAVDLVAREFDALPADIRLRLGTLANEGNGSGNVRKGVQRLDRLLNGKLMREKVHTETFRKMGADGWQSRSVNPAVAGATRKYGVVR